jgi:di/tricarboxylate transporter
VNPAPIAYQLAQESHADPKPFMVGLAICISTSFCTPVAHETTMLADGSVSTTLYGFTPN